MNMRTYKRCGRNKQIGDKNALRWYKNQQRNFKFWQQEFKKAGD